MFTVEFESDTTVLRTLDDTGQFEDVEVYLEEDGKVFIRQYDEKHRTHDVIICSYNQLVDLFAAMSKTTGSYFVELADEQ